MNIYKIDNGKFCYDCYDSHIIVANNEQEVISLAKSEHSDTPDSWWDEATITLEGLYTGSNTDPFILLKTLAGLPILSTQMDAGIDNLLLSLPV